jgi:hypothetical protein
VLAWAEACVEVLEALQPGGRWGRLSRRELLWAARRLCPGRWDEAVAAVHEHTSVERVVPRGERWEKPRELAAHQEREYRDATRIPLPPSPQGDAKEAAIAAWEASVEAEEREQAEERRASGCGRSWVSQLAENGWSGNGWGGR